MVIKALDYVPHCYTSHDGAVIASLILAGFADGKNVTVSFSGVGDVPSSFVNSAFLSLLDDYPYDYIQQHLSVVDSTWQINNMIRHRFEFETKNLQIA